MGESSRYVGVTASNLAIPERLSDSVNLSVLFSGFNKSPRSAVDSTAFSKDNLGVPRILSGVTIPSMLVGG